MRIFLVYDCRIKCYCKAYQKHHRRSSRAVQPTADCITRHVFFGLRQARCDRNQMSFVDHLVRIEKIYNILFFNNIYQSIAPADTHFRLDRYSKKGFNPNIHEYFLEGAKKKLKVSNYWSILI